MAASEPARIRGFEFLRRALRPDRGLPEYVFTDRWSSFLFFNADWVRSGHADFPDFARALLDAQGADCLVLDNRTEFDSPAEFGREIAVFDRSLTPDLYRAQINVEVEGVPWNAIVPRYGFASDRGGWCVYGDSREDIAVLGANDPGLLGAFRPVLERWHARPLEDWLRIWPGHAPLVPSWREGLTRNYGGGPTRELTGGATAATAAPRPPPR